MLLGVSSNYHLLILKCFSGLCARGLRRIMMVCINCDIYEGCAASSYLVSVHTGKKNALNLQSPPPKQYLFLHHSFSIYFNLYLRLFQLSSECGLFQNLLKREISTKIICTKAPTGNLEIVSVKTQKNETIAV